MVEARVCVYEIVNLDYSTFGRGAKRYSSPAEVIETLGEWVEDLSFEDTGLEHLNRGRSYCYDMVEHHEHGVLLALWNEEALIDAKTLYASKDATVGSVLVTPKKAPPNTVSGRPAYFWFPSGWQHMCALNFNNRPASKDRLTNYLRCFMNTSCEPYCVAHGDEKASVATVNGPESQNGEALQAVVRFDLMISEQQALDSAVRNVRTIHFKEELIRKPQAGKGSKAARLQKPAPWELLFGHSYDEPPKTSKIHYHFDVPEGISKALYEEVVETFSRMNDDRDVDIGFKLKDQKTRWLSKRRVVSHVDLAVKEASGVIVDSSKLLEILGRQREAIMRGDASVRPDGTGQKNGGGGAS